MIDQVLEVQQKMTVDFNGKFDDVYTNPNNKFQVLNIHVNKLETEVVQTNDIVRRQEALIKEKGKVGRKHQVNAIIKDDF